MVTRLDPSKQNKTKQKGNFIASEVEGQNGYSLRSNLKKEVEIPLVK